MPHEHLSLQCLHGLQRNANHDDDGSTADGQVLHGSHDVPGNDGQQGNDGQIHGAKYHDLVADLLDEVGGGLAGTEARNDAAVLLQIGTEQIDWAKMMGMTPVMATLMGILVF